MSLNKYFCSSICLKFLEFSTPTIVISLLILKVSKSGSRERYDNQKANFDKNKIKERQLLALVNIINTEKKGLDSY
jgi:hypothetical protein